MSRVRQRTALCLVIFLGAVGSSIGKPVEELRTAGDFEGLLSKLRDPDALVRRDAAIALPGVVNKINDPARLKRSIGRLTEARLRDPWKTTREYSGRALMTVLSRTTDESALRNTIRPLVDALAAGEVELDRRRFAAVALSGVVIKLERVDLLAPRVPDLHAATFSDPDKTVREYAGRALQHTLQKLAHQPTLALSARSLAGQLGSDDLRAQRYAAVQLSGLVPKLTGRDAQKALLGPITQAATKARDEQVREYAGRALRHLERVLKEEHAVGPDLAKEETITKDGPHGARRAVETRPLTLEAARLLLQGLEHRDGKVRAQSAHDLSRAIERINDAATLARLAGPLATATLRSESMNADDFPGFTLRTVLRKIDDEKTLIPVTKTLLKGLNHEDETIRGFCIHGLSENMGKIEDKKTLRSTVGALHTATLKSDSTEARDFAGLALRSVLRRTDDEATVLPVLESSIARLDHEDSTMQAFYAHTLHENVRKIRNRAALTRMLSPLTTAALQAEDTPGEGMTAAGLSHSALKQLLDEVDDQRALISIIRPLATALQSEHVTRRRVAAHTAMLIGPKIKDKSALSSLAPPLITAHFHDSDQRVRESAGLALRKSFRQVPDAEHKR